MKQRHINSQQGFTLVEMTVVLVVIGLILGAISIGKDVQRDAENSKIKQKFVDQWVIAYNDYYSKAGVVVGDSQVAPRYMVNGEAFATVSASVISGTNMTGVTEPNAICEAVKGANMVRSKEDGSGGNNNASLHALMDRLGIRMPPGRAEGKEDRYVYLDSNGNPQEIQVCFQWNKPGTPSGSGNVMVISGLTPDLARQLDQMVDGKPDAQEGVFRQEGVANGTQGAPGVQWAANNTQQYGNGTPSATDTAVNKDEDQVITVVAHYKMNQ